MKKLKLIVVFALSLSTFYVNSQKLPNIQLTSVRAPANVKIDGKAGEWGNHLQAYNKTTSISYTLANDDVNLYLIVQSTDLDIASKIIRGGITLTINISEKRDFKNSCSITFPKYEKGKQVTILTDRPQKTTDTLKNNYVADSLAFARNKLMAEKMTLIEIRGIKGVDNGLLSIYNEEGITVNTRFDNKLKFTYELAIPLRYLINGVNINLKFAYNIKLNGLTANGGTVQSLYGRDDRLFYTDVDGQVFGLGEANPRNMELAYPTDFWGEYTLARK